MITENTRIVLVKNPEIADLGGEKAMIDFDTGKYYLLKGSANAIWDHIQKDIAIGELIEKLMEEYDVDKETCTKSTISFIEELRQNGFLTLT